MSWTSAIVMVIEVIILAITVFFLLKYYAEKSEYPIYTISIYCSWFLGFIGVLLFPLDLGVAATPDESSDSAFVTFTWELVYWITFILAWVYLPVLMEYWASGRFTKKSRILESAWVNIKCYIPVVIIGILAFVWYCFATQFNISLLQGWVMGIANTYGLLFIIVFLGYGLGELPLSLWLKRDRDIELAKKYEFATHIDVELYDAQTSIMDMKASIEEVEKTAKNTNMMTSNVKAVFDKLYSSIPNDKSMDYKRVREIVQTKNMYRMKVTNDQLLKMTREEGERYIINELAQLNTLLKRSINQYYRKQAQWTELVQRCLYLTGKTDQGESLGFLMRQYFKFRKLIMTVASGISIVFSVLMFWCEITTVILEIIGSDACLSPFGLILLTGASSTTKNIMSLIPLIYLSICMYRSFFRLRIPFIETYTLFHKHSDVYALCFNAYYICRLQFTLCYHYFSILQVPKSIYERSSLYNIMGQMETVPFLGSTFNHYVPLLVFLFSFFSFTKLFSIPSCKKVEKGESLLASDTTSDYEEGKKLVEIAMKKAMKTINTSPVVVAK
ncbi:hypothetical protein WA158_007123 [Blastocystis sp. Blastoise]